MTDINAVIGSCQLKRFKQFHQKRLCNAAYYSRRIKHSFIRVPSVPFSPPSYTHSFHQYTIRVLKKYPLSRDDLRLLLLEHGIESGIYYPIPIYAQPAYGVLFPLISFPETEMACAEVLSLPVHPLVGLKEIDKIVDIINNPEKYKNKGILGKHMASKSKDTNTVLSKTRSGKQKKSKPKKSKSKKTRSKKK